MTKILWDKPGERLYENGVKYGVLYPQAGDGSYPLGVAWNGLTAVTESPGGAEATPLYADDTKYLNLLSAETFGATVEAYTYPSEFAQCDGTAEIATGVTIGQQSRKTFGMTYRTVLGNDIDTDAHGYKLHIVYGAIAAPSEKAYATVNDSPEAITFSWELSTTPVAVTGKKPTASLTIDSTKVNPANLAALEAILYGVDGGADPRLPLPDEIAALFGTTAPSAVALSSISPADAATGVAVGVNIVLTFNNKISKEAVVVTTAAGTIVPVVKTWDATGKILTIDPVSNMAASTVHLVSIAGVTDIYNSVLAAAVKKFTTA